MPSFSLSSMMPVEELFPVAVAGHVVVGDEERRDALLVVLADDRLEIVGVAEPALAALHVDDGAERALERAAAAEVEARHACPRCARAPTAADAASARSRCPAGRPCSCRGGFSVPFQASCSTTSKRPSSASPAKIEMPMSMASWISGGTTGSIDRQPAAWKPPIATCRPAARNLRARSTACGNWLDWTPTRQISALAAAALEIGNDLVGADADVGLVERLDDDIDVGPKHLAAGSPRPGHGARPGCWTGCGTSAR